MWGSNSKGQRCCVQKVCDHSFGISKDDLGGQLSNSVSWRATQELNSVAAAKGERVGKYFLKPNVWEVPVKTFGE